MKVCPIDVNGDQITDTDIPWSKFDKNYTEYNTLKICSFNFYYGFKHCALLTPNNKYRYMSMEDFLSCVDKFNYGVIEGEFEFYKRPGSSAVRMRLKNV